MYVGLCTDVAEDGTITGEPSGSSYARVAVTNNATNFPAASGGSKANGATINTADITNPETGVYYYDYTLTQEGLLVYEFSGTFLTKTILRRESIDVVFV